MDGILTVFFFALGAVSASFALVVAERIHTGESWQTGRSRCNSCARTLSGRDLVPILSYLMHRGRCRECGAGVPAGYLVAEALLGAAFTLAYGAVGLSFALLPLLLSLVLLTSLVWYDLRHLILPTGLMLPLLALSLAYAALAAPSSASLGATLMLAGGIGLFFFLFHLLSGGRAMGLGDAPLSVALSLLTGPLALSGLVYSFWIGGVIGVIVLLRRAGGTKIGSEVPFAPFLAGGFLLALFTSWDILAILGIR